MNTPKGTSTANGAFTLMALTIAMATLVVLFGIEPVSGESDAPERRYINGIYAPVPDQERLNRLYEAARHDSAYVDSIREGRQHFSGLDVEASLDSMTDDAQLIHITDEGIAIRVDGRDQMRATLSRTLTGQASSPAGRWVPEKSGGETWGIYKNIKVTYHYATFVRDDGTEWTRPTILVAEHKDGKRWREWRYFPVDR